MWVGFLVGMLATGQIGVQAAPEPFQSKEECEALNQVVEKEQLPKIKELKAYVLQCVEVTSKAKSNEPQT